MAHGRHRPKGPRTREEPLKESELRYPDPGHTRTVDVPASLAVDVASVRQCLRAGNGGYEILHVAPGLEVGVYVLVAPEPDRQQPHADDELYYVLDGCTGLRW
ncbi:MAG: hypothetical protein ABIP53_00405 [Candidatus Limnocylindrales bacterium]